VKPDPRPVTVVILTFNGLKYTQRCLATLQANTTHPDYHVIVVDNASTDGTPEFLQTLESIRLIRNADNLGFARANNIGIREADAQHDIVLLNNDTEIYQADWLSLMQETAHSAREIGPVGCRLVQGDGTLRHAGAYMPVETLWGRQIGGGERDINQYNDIRDVESVVFACVYLKRELLDAVGLLDEDYFCYFEDTDYCYRAAARGYRTFCCGAATVVHHENVSTQVNAIPHSRYFLNGQQVFQSKWAESLRKNRYTSQLGWHSTVSLPLGYAAASVQLISALDRRRVHVSYEYVYGPGTPISHMEREEECPPGIDIIRGRRLKPDLTQVVFAQGDVLESNFGAYKIGFTMLETDGIPHEWVRQANLMDEVWVPSQFNVATFRASGVTRPLHVIPLGVDTNYFNPRLSRHSIPGLYSFLSVFEWGERKAPEVLLRAFNQEFTTDEPVILIVKSSNVDPGVDPAIEISGLGLDPKGGRIHFSLNQMIPAYQLGVLYRSADCFVLPTRGEGWGMPVLEAMACGLPVIATGWSALCDFMTPENSYLLGVDRLVAAKAKCPYYEGFRWAEPSLKDLRRLMRHVYQNQGEARARGERASLDVRRQWTWDHAAQKIADRLDTIVRNRS
jgi:GT2 family glycosyltransferase